MPHLIFRSSRLVYKITACSWVTPVTASNVRKLGVVSSCRLMSIFICVACSWFAGDVFTAKNNEEHEVSFHLMIRAASFHSHQTGPQKDWMRTFLDASGTISIPWNTMSVWFNAFFSNLNPSHVSNQWYGSICFTESLLSQDVGKVSISQEQWHDSICHTWWCYHLHYISLSFEQLPWAKWIHLCTTAHSRTTPLQRIWSQLSTINTHQLDNLTENPSGFVLDWETIPPENSIRCRRSFSRSQVT